MYARAKAAINCAIFDFDDEHKWTSTGTPCSSTMRRALPGLKAKFHKAPKAVSWTSYNRDSCKSTLLQNTEHCENTQALYEKDNNSQPVLTSATKDSSSETSLNF